MDLRTGMKKQCQIIIIAIDLHHRHHHRHHHHSNLQVDLLNFSVSGVGLQPEYMNGGGAGGPHCVVVSNHQEGDHSVAQRNFLGADKIPVPWMSWIIVIIIIVVVVVVVTIIIIIIIIITTLSLARRYQKSKSRTFTVS